jgi:hypothetical protein
MKALRWNVLKSERLKRTRGASFEELIQSKLIAVKRHPTKAHQHVLLFEHQRYIWVVPYVESERDFFLKTLYPSRKYTKLYRKGELR